MKQKVTKLVRFFWDPICVTAGILPFSFLVYARFVPEILPWAWIFPAIYGLSFLVCMHVPEEKIGTATTCSIILVLLAGAALLTLQFKLSVMVAAAGIVVMLIVRMSEGGASISAYIFMALHVYTQIQILVKRITENPMYEPIAGISTISFFVFLLMSMLSMNRDNLQDVTMGRQKIPKSMQKKQRSLTIGLFAAAVGVAAIPAVVRVVSDFVNWLLHLFLAFMDWLTRLISGQESDDPPIVKDAVNGFATDTNKSEFVQNLEGIIAVLLIVAIAVVFGWIAIKIIIRLVKIFRELWKKLGRNKIADQETYEDEITSTREDFWKDWMDALAARRKLNSVDEKSLNPGERIRYRYLRLLMKHREWHSGKTARENLPDPAASLYERARYSQHLITEEDAQQFIADVKKI